MLDDPPEEFLILHMRLARRVFLFLTALSFGGLLGAGALYIPEFFALVGWPPRVSSLKIIIETNVILLLSWLAVSFVLLLLTLITYRESWILNDESLTHIGFFRKKQIPLDGITKLAWWPISRVIVLKDVQHRISLFIEGMPIQQRLNIIEHLHKRVPQERQKYWPMFERMIVQKLRVRCHQEANRVSHNAGSRD